MIEMPASSTANPDERSSDVSRNHSGIRRLCARELPRGLTGDELPRRLARRARRPCRRHRRGRDADRRHLGVARPVRSLQRGDDPAGDPGRRRRGRLPGVPAADHRVRGPGLGVALGLARRSRGRFSGGRRGPSGRDEFRGVARSNWKANRQEDEMTETQSTTAITEVATVIVPVADQDRALEFYVETLGFEKRMDMPYGDGNRWLEVVPPGAATGIALVPPREGESAGIETRIALRTEDADAIHAELRDGGVEGRGGHADGRPRAADVL